MHITLRITSSFTQVYKTGKLHPMGKKQYKIRLKMYIKYIKICILK